MTKKIFWQDPYLTHLDTHVKTVNGNQLTVHETIFYAFSGGQESDHGTLGSKHVLDANKDGLEIIYTIDGEHHFNEGDWDRRYRLMRLHFAAEVVLELVCHRFPDVVKIGAHIAEDKARIDFKWDKNISPFIPEL